MTFIQKNMFYNHLYTKNNKKNFCTNLTLLLLEAPQKTNTSVPSMFQGLLNIEDIWVQHRVSPEPFNLLLWNFHRMLIIYKTFIWINNNRKVTWLFAAILGSHIENINNAYKQLFMQKKDKTPIYTKYQTRIYSDTILFHQK